MSYFCRIVICGESFARFRTNTHKGALEKSDGTPYLAIAAPQWRDITSSNTRRERNDDDDIDDLHDPCRVFDRSNPLAYWQTLARVLSLKTNVTARHSFVSQNR